MSLPREGVPLSAAEARRDMGKAKHDHLRAILADPGVAGALAGRQGRAAVAKPTSSASIASSYRP